MLVGLALFLLPRARGYESQKRPLVRPAVGPAAGPKQPTSSTKRASQPTAPQSAETRRPPKASSHAEPSPQRPPEAPAADTMPKPVSVRTGLLLGCLAFLRYELGTDWAGVMEPFSVDPKDPIAVNDALKRLAAHGGLRGLRFIVGIRYDGPERGGSIELRTGQAEVFMEVSTAASAFGPSLLAVLAHQVSHKVLFDRLIHQQGDDEERYEILVDVAAVYLGFGKLLLNGYEYKSRRRGADATARVNQHVQLGHISVEEVAFVHAMACYLRELRSLDWYPALSPFARRTMARVINDAEIRRLLDAAPLLAPQKSYLRPSRHATTASPRTEANPTHGGDREAAAAPQGSASPREPKVQQARPSRIPTEFRPMSPELERLHDRLLTLVYGDVKLVGRLVELERRRHPTIEARYKAAIERLIRDRS